MADFVLVGLSHKSAPIAVREKLAFPEEQLTTVLGDLSRLPSIGEVMLVSTCNRVEVLATAKARDAAQTLLEHLVACAQDNSLRSHLYLREGESAVVHLFRVAASLDSMVVGEPQILGQVKDAFELAVQSGFARGEISRACQAAFAAAKRVRSETQIGQAAVSMASAAVELARKIFGQLASRTVLVVGVGTMSELCARHLLAAKSRVRVTNRTAERAVQLCAAMGEGAEARPFEQLASLLVEADIVISSTAAPRPIFTREMVQAALKARKNRPLFFVDLAVPRDVDPSVSELDNVFAYDVDDLDRVVAENMALRASEAERAGVIVAEEVARFIRERSTREAVPVLAQLRARAEEIAQAEVQRTLAAIGEALSDKQKKSVEAMSRAIVNKLLHEPTARLRSAGAAGPEEAARLVQAAAELFGLDEPSSTPADAANTANAANATNVSNVANAVSGSGEVRDGPRNEAVGKSEANKEGAVTPEQAQEGT
jgi:glutamyl-tRNA reductase